MIPYVIVAPIQLGPFTVTPFGILATIAVLLGSWLATRRAIRLGIPDADIRSFLTWILVGGFVGGHVIDMVFYYPDELVARPWRLLAIWTSLGSFSGFAGALAGAFAWRRWRRRKILPLADIVVAVFPVAWIFGRAGCSVAHDHPGRRAAAGAWLAVADGPGPTTELGPITLRYGTLPRYDLGLLEMLLAIVLAVAFALTWKRGGMRGWYIAAACLVYAPVRFGMDFLRVADPTYGALTPGQWASIALFGFGAGLTWWLARRPAPAV